MTYTKITIQYLDRAPTDADLIASQASTDAYIAAAVSAGKTNGICTPVSEPLVHSRIWVDQAAAQDWKDFTVAQANSYGYTKTVVMQDIV